MGILERTAEETEEKRYLVCERRNAAAAYRRFRAPALPAGSEQTAALWKLTGAAIGLLCALGVLGWLAF